LFQWKQKEKQFSKGGGGGGVGGWGGGEQFSHEETVAILCVNGWGQLKKRFKGRDVLPQTGTGAREELHGVRPAPKHSY